MDNHDLTLTVTGSAWKKIGTRSHQGINLPLSALHSNNSCGIGEFFDLLPLIDWCHSLKIDFIQLLPLNSSGKDPSPYDAISSCALNIVYLSLHALPFLEQLPQLTKKLNDLKVFNQTKRVAYDEVLTQKLIWLRIYFGEVGEKMLESEELKSFLSDHSWVEPYALFRTLQDHHAGIPWMRWPQEHHFLSDTNIKALIQSNWPQASFYIVLQFLCFTQLKKVKEYANSKSLFLMGDFPFLVNTESVDAWLYPDFFDFTHSGGAPPDAYNQDGQDWGCPIYRWDKLRKKDFSWWKQRLKYAENFFDLVRLDHVLGFFRIWAVPLNRPPKEGHFVPENESLWEPQGKELLSMVATSSSMLPIAEDLGTVPDMVRPCLQEMGICGTKVMRWERKWKEDKRFIPIQEYPPVSITCISTHDMDTLSLWWKNYPEEAKEFAQFKHWDYTPYLTNPQREEILWDSHHTASLFHVNLLQEYFALFQELSSPHPEDERINIPGKVLPTNWTYRFTPSVETIISHKELFLKMKKILHE